MENQILELNCNFWQHFLILYLLFTRKINLSSILITSQFCSFKYYHIELVTRCHLTFNIVLTPPKIHIVQQKQKLSNWALQWLAQYSVRSIVAVIIHTGAWGRIMDWLSALPLPLGNLILHLTIKQRKSLIYWQHSI